MKYISHFLGKQVHFRKKRQGVLKDWIMTASPSQAVLSGLVIEDAVGSERAITMADVESLGLRTVHLRKPLAECALMTLADGALLLAEHILDKQVVDTRKKKVYRVNDIEVQEEQNHYLVRWVDAGLTGLLGRLGVPEALQPKAGRLQRRIAWADVEPLDPDLKSNFAKLSKLHPADIADIVEELGVTQGADLLERLDDETAAGALTEVEPAMQSDIVGEIKPADAADIIEEMEPDDAADLISDLPQDTARRIMNEMESEEKAEVQELLQYLEDSAGGIMNNEYLSVTTGQTVEQVLTKFREDKPEPEVAYNLIVTEGHGKLAGVLSLRDLVVSPPQAVIDGLLSPDSPSVGPGTSLAEVADLFSKYDLVLLPVVDGQNRVLGVITVDDVIELIVPKQWKRSHRKRML
ncbi:MAG: CBS domain-containing protein [Candidatus Edwardsbacteria bacterium]|nr:CBS domain-containing protein [Candidatus Edwardsbacteria bacterium]